MSDFLGDADFELYRKLIYDESGITFSTTNRSILESRLKERLREKKLDSLKEYFSLITRDKEELKTLLDSVTTNLTRFFRNQAHFDAIEKYVVPELIKLRGGSGERKLRFWSAGCSTGEEPYTLAMLLKEILPAGWSFEIVASDISLKCLMVGQGGLLRRCPRSGHSRGLPAQVFRSQARRLPAKGRDKEVLALRLPQPQERFRPQGPRCCILPQCPDILRRGRAEGRHREVLGGYGAEILPLYRTLRIALRHEHQIRIREDRLGDLLSQECLRGVLAVPDPVSVLVVDDSALMRNLISKIIEATPGLKVADKAMNGVFALQKIPRCNPDVIVLDIEMPEMNGIEFLKERKRLGLDIPVIILSSLAKEGAAVTMEALALGAADFITKPSGSVSSDIHTVAGQLSRLLLAYGSQHQRRKGKNPPRYEFEAPERMFEPAPVLDERAARASEARAA